jgi:hypothetical protein
LEPLIQTPGFATRAADRADSSERARSLLYLGVAYFAKGRTDRADTAFRFACALDPGVELDKFYVTPAIAGHFDAVRTESRRGSLEREALARAVRSAPAAAPAPSGRRQADRKVLKEDPRWVWWGLGTAALVAAGGGAYWYAQQASGPREIVTTLDVRGNR